MRSLVLGNGSFLLTLDNRGEVRDLYFPHVGLENHAGGALRHRLGVFVDGQCSWLAEDERWHITVQTAEDSLESSITAEHAVLGVRLQLRDLVYNERAIFVREVTVENMRPDVRTVKIYFGHEFQISHSPGGDTAYYDPSAHALIHYKGPRAFLASGRVGSESFDDYAVGLLGTEGRDGTFRDAEDGALSKNTIEHGAVDSVLGFTLSLEAKEKKILHYWLAAATSIEAVTELHQYVLQKTPAHLLRTAGDYWRAWTHRYDWHFHALSNKAVSLFNTSLMFVRAHADNGGGIIASADAETLQYKEDTYAYVWPRDASYGALALLRAGDSTVTERFFSFCKSVITDDGYFMHKYLPDTSLGSSWHPWLRDGVLQLPIQEDETALVVWSLAEQYRHSKDLEFIEDLYNPVIKKAADFMCTYRDESTGLPRASYDLWEEKHGISTFTSAATYGALQAAAELAQVLGKRDDEKRYQQAATEIRDAILTHLACEEAGGFVKQIETLEKKTTYDRTPDISSVYGIFAFGVLPPNDPQLVKAFKKTTALLTSAGGITRYVGDKYYRRGEASNPWFITTLWHAQYLIACARSDKDLVPVRARLEWVTEHAQDSGALSEQLDAITSMQSSVAPLMWSHAAYVNTVLDYLDALERLGVCKDCNPAP